MFFSLITSAKSFGVPVLAASVVVSGLTVAAPAEAMNLVGKYSVHAAQKDHYGRSNSNHVIWDLGGKSYVTKDVGDLWWSEYDDGTAKLTGQVFGKDDWKIGWDVDITFSTTSEGNKGPKKELKDKAYKDDSPVDVSKWVYYAFEENKLEQFKWTKMGKDYTGLTAVLSDKTNGGYPAQVGIGANGKNINYGMSTWFKADLYKDDEYWKTDWHGDINVDFKPKDVPTPAAGLAWLLTSGAAIARKRKEERENEG